MCHAVSLFSSAGGAGRSQVLDEMRDNGDAFRTYRRHLLRQSRTRPCRRQWRAPGGVVEVGRQLVEDVAVLLGAARSEAALTAVMFLCHITARTTGTAGVG
jgi:hypothetical protein